MDEKFGKEWMRVSQQDNFDGFRLEAVKGVNKWLQTTHSLFLGTSLSPTQYIYQVGPAFQHEEKGLTLMARAGLDGSVNCRAMKKVSDAVEFKFSGNSNLGDERRNMYEFATDYTGKGWTGQGKIAFQGSWILNGTFTQEVTRNLQMGSELTWILGSPGAIRNMSMGAFGLRYATGGHVWTATLSRQPDFGQSPLHNSHSAKVEYVRTVSERLSLGAQLELSLPDKDSALRACYEYTFRHARVQGTADTAGRVSCFISDFMGMGISGMIDFVRGEYKFGLMMHMVPPPEGEEQK